ncbi:MAG TPA: NAD(P)-binding domain-containing protein [Acidimicrobiia bacterium]|jgi:putative flavoprotein involved in K+ transport|nr:NAD(P)-binding domain-containing protein [Acidimicrobiia bacterium]
MSEQIETIVIGGGQAGLAVGYHLHRNGLPFLILDENPRIGDVWRNRWDSLRLFTPAAYSGLPGMPFPGPRSAYPTKDETAAYFEAYAERFALPVRTGVKVDRLSDTGDGFVVTAGDDRLLADNVVVATGAYQHPLVPSFSTQLDNAIVQLHSTEYHNPDQLREGGVLVVGAGNSGAEIALDIASHHQVWLSGPDTGQEPTRAGTIPDRLLTPILWLAATRLTVGTAPGRKLRDRFIDPPRGIPLGRVRRKDIIAAGIERVPRTIGVMNGNPVLESGRVLEVSNVIWCTGFTHDYDWITPPIAIDKGFPIHNRGILESSPGLYFIGLRFLYSLSSALLGGVGRDAEHIVDHIVSTRHLRREVMNDNRAKS